MRRGKKLLKIFYSDKERIEKKEQMFYNDLKEIIGTGEQLLNGTAHIVLGAAMGFIVANTLKTDPTDTMILVGIGGVSGLIPDMDIDGKLSNKITFSHKAVKAAAQMIGLLMMAFSYVQGSGMERWIGIGAGLAIIAITSFITQRRMLTITGIGVFIGGLTLQENWLSLLGIYIVAASFVPHRSYTHSLLGIAFFGIIAFQFQASFEISGSFLAGMAGYISHLAADLKALPFNKRGVKIFLPFSSKEF